MKALALSLFLGCLTGSASATVTMEFHLGGARIPAGSLGVLVADSGLNGFTSPFSGGGTLLAPG